MWLDGPKGTKTLSDRRMFGARDLGLLHGEPDGGYDEEVNKLYTKEHGNEAHELHRREDALFLAWRDEEDLK